VRVQATRDRLRRGEGLGYAEAAQHGLNPNALTIGFARRMASYKRIHLLGADPDRALALLAGDRAEDVLDRAREADAAARSPYGHIDHPRSRSMTAAPRGAPAPSGPRSPSCHPGSSRRQARRRAGQRPDQAGRDRLRGPGGTPRCRRRGRGYRQPPSRRSPQPRPRRRRSRWRR
jgi:hypothetical protein